MSVPGGSGGNKRVASRYVHEGRVLKLRIDTFRLPNGKEVEREVVEHRGAVALVAFDNEERVLLVRQYRAAVERPLLELPAGTLEAGEEPEKCAARELAEETGFRPGRLKLLTGFYSAPGFCSEYLHIYQANDLAPEHAEADEDEDIQVERQTLAECVELIRAGEIRDAKSIVGILAVRAGWGNEPA